jgi:hypothetical protein
MHEEVHAQTNSEKKDYRQITDDMRLVLLPQEIPRDHKENGQTQAVSEPQGIEKTGPAHFFGHTDLLFGYRTDTEHAHGQTDSHTPRYSMPPGFPAFTGVKSARRAA